MDIGAVDRSATSDLGWLHRVSPVAKLVALALVIAAVVVTWNLFLALGLLLFLAATAVTARLDLKLTFSLAAYPAVFAVIFALASAPDALYGSVIVLKAVAAGLSAVIVILTTPYPQVFAPVQRIVPGIVGDALLMTYRSFFLLLDKFGNLLRAVRLRAGLRGTHPVLAARSVTQALGGLLLYSVDLAEREYDVMRLRGYSGRLRVGALKSRSRAGDAAVISAAALGLAISIVWRLGWVALNPYSWLLPIPALLLLASAGVYRSASREAVR